MKSLYIKWLRFCGYKPFKYGVVTHSWGGETPPSYGYYPYVTLKKGLSFKDVNFSNLRGNDRERVAQLAQDLFKELEEQS